MRKWGILFTIVSLVFAFNAWGEDQRFTASLEMDRVSVGNPLYLYLTFYGGQDIDAPKMPEIDGLKLNYVGPSTKVSVVNGKVSQSITHTYLVMPLKAGRYVLGPFSAEHRGKTYTSGSVVLVAGDKPTGAPRPRSSGAPSPVTAPSRPVPDQPRKSYAGDKVFLSLETGKTEAYVNEVIPVTLKIYVNNVGLKDIEYPTYPHEGISVSEFKEPERRTEVKGGVRYDVLIFSQEAFGVKEGNYTLGPARLSCKVMVRKARPRRSSLFGRSIFDDDFFSSRAGYTSYPIEIESEQAPIRILPFPEAGKPSNFRGAVGNFAMDAHVDPANVKVGDPVILRMGIRGHGNLDTVTAPQVIAGDDFKTYEPQITQKNGKKEYEQILIPRTTDVRSVPEVTFSFFNPGTRRYETVRRGPFPIQVSERPESEQGVKMVSVPGAGEEVIYPKEELGQDIIHIKDNIGTLRPAGRYLYNDPLFLAAQVLPAALFMAFFAGYRRHERMLTDSSYARSLKAPRKARKGLARAKACLGKKDLMPFYDAVFKMLQDYLGDRFDLPKGGITGEAIEERIRGANRGEEMAGVLKDIFARCEMARYAPAGLEEHDAEQVLDKVRMLIDYLEKVRV